MPRRKHRHAGPAAARPVGSRKRTRAPLRVQLHHVSIRERVVAIHLLPGEARRAPDARVLETLGDVLAHRDREIVDRGAAPQDERALRSGFFPRSLA